MIYSCLEITGLDAPSFITRQASRDEGYMAFLTPQAKVIAFAFYQPPYLISSNASELKTHLNKFIITEDIEILEKDFETQSVISFEPYAYGDSLIKLYEERPEILDKYVSFTKGCFPGQEALAKFKNIGLRKREERSLEQTQEAISEAAKSNTNEDLELAIQKLKSALKDNPKNEDAMEALGVLLAKQSKYQEALKVMHQLEMINPNHLMAQVNLSIIYMKLGDKDTAEQHKARATVIQFSRGCCA